MIPAEVKKRENIAEYIIHMYQTEDLIISYDYDLNEIYEYVIKHMSKDEDELKKVLLWYADIISKMKEEKLADTGARLSQTQEYVARLTALHNTLLNDNDEYRSLVSNSEGDINRQIIASANSIINPLQIFINGVYGMLLVKLNGNQLPNDQQDMINRFGKILAFLSKKYKEQVEP